MFISSRALTAVERIYTEEAIATAISNTAINLNVAMHSVTKPIIVLGVLPSSLYYLSDLTKHFTFKFDMDFIGVERDSEGTPILKYIPKKNLRDTHVIAIDNVASTGNSLNMVKNHLLDRGCHDMSFTALITKVSEELRDKNPNYFDCLLYEGDNYLHGNRLDYTNTQRSLTEGIYITKTLEV